MAKKDFLTRILLPAAMLLAPNQENLQRAVAEIEKGQLVIFPTETVYGLGGNALDDKAVASIFEKKNRPQFNPLIIHVLGIEQASHYAEWDERAEKLARHFWPGPLTLILKRKLGCPISRLASAGLDSIALRAPAHPVAREFLEVCSLPLAGPSANRSGLLSPTSGSHAEQEFPDLLILDGGPCPIGLESTVLSLLSREAALLRFGAISASEISQILGEKVIDGTREKEIRSPGQLLRHYATIKPLRINVRQMEKDEALLAFGPGPFPAQPFLNLSPSGDLTEAAANLFAMLHEMDDHPSVKKIAIMPIPQEGLGMAINDRLARAAYVAEDESSTR